MEYVQVCLKDLMTAFWKFLIFLCSVIDTKMFSNLSIRIATDYIYCLVAYFSFQKKQRSGSAKNINANTWGKKIWKKKSGRKSLQHFPVLLSLMLASLIKITHKKHCYKCFICILRSCTLILNFVSLKTALTGHHSSC